MLIRIFITLIMIGISIAVMYWLSEPFGGLVAVMVGSLIFILGLSVWTLPAGTFERGHPTDPLQRRLIGAFLGVGLGMLGGMLVAALVPRPFNWLVLGAVALTLTIWWYRKS
jgi:hypothetical protein